MTGWCDYSFVPFIDAVDAFMIQIRKKNEKKSEKWNGEIITGRELCPSRS